ncbi:MAG: glycosyltransferase family 2 protein [Parvularcula sp.]|jgi:dolichol-phosphate mannosyltransferase|nr:glycosyltransferase family 2 protein [Parvularcula sp.]
MADAGFTIIIPVFNEAENIVTVIAEALEATEDHRAAIIVVDDGSSDGTADRVEQADFGERVRLIRHPRRSGKSAALRTGMIAAQTIWVGTMDGDGQDNPEDLVAMTREVRLSEVAEVGLVGGVRKNRTDGSSRKTASRFANGLRQRLLRDDCPDTACGLKLVARDLFLAMPFYDSLHRYLPAWNKHFGFDAVYVPVTNRERMAGASKYSNFGRAVAGFFDLMGVVWLMRRTSVPSGRLLLRGEAL